LKKKDRPLIAAAVLAIAMTACSAPSSDNKSDGTGNPFDAIKAEALETVQAEESRLRLDCLATEGFPQYRDAMAGYQRTQTYRDRLPKPNEPTGIFLSEDDARSRGFGESLQASPPKVIIRDAAIEDAITKCGKESWKAMGPGAEEIYNDYLTLSNNIVSSMGTIPLDTWNNLTEHTAKCLNEGGHDVVADPSARFGITFTVPLGSAARPDMPEPPQAGNFVATGQPAVKYSPTEEEADLAVAYYKCTVSSGLRDDFVRVAVDAARVGVTKYEGQLSELSPQIEALAKHAGSVAIGTS
jgi:hypothetical protein